MDRSLSVKNILESYEEITIDREFTKDIIFFKLYGKTFLFLAPFEDVPSSSARIYLFNDELLDYPHIMLRNDDFPNRLGLPEGTYRWICLFEHDSVVYSLVPYEEKIRDAIDRLVELMSMNIPERNREYQKEFMFYWNNSSSDGTIYTAYLSQEESFAEMQLYYSKGEARIIEKGLILSDNDDRLKGERVWTQHIENDVFYIPIVDSQEILPPTRGYKWTASDIKNIVYGDQIEHIHNDSFQMLKNCIPKTQNIILLFGMKTEQMEDSFVEMNRYSYQWFVVLRKDARVLTGSHTGCWSWLHTPVQ